jgi:hypothetical protein
LEKITDKVAIDMTVEDFKSIGLAFGEAKLLKKEIEVFASPVAGRGAASEYAAATCKLSGAISVLPLGSHRHPITSAVSDGLLC